MSKYTWFKCGYVEFENSVKFYFTGLQFEITHFCDCDEVVALKCS